jgi:peptidoglycan-associated lipoprotein
MKRHTFAVVCVALALLSACGGKKRPPAVLTDPGQTAGRPTATATPEPEEPVNTGPDIRSVGSDNPSGEDFSVTDAGGESGGPLDDVYFDYDAAALGDQARAVLEKHALWLQNHRAAKVTVEGHCDERGTTDYNLALGDKRARAARDYLASLGVAADRLHTVSFGKERPVDTGTTEQAFAKNRRAHFVVSR